MQKKDRWLDSNLGMIILSTLFIFGSFIVQILIETLMKCIGIEDKYICDSVSRLLVIAGAISIVVGVKWNIDLGLGGKGIKLGLLLGWPIYIAMAINIYDVCTMSHIEQIPSVFGWISYILYVFAIGVYEEVVLRGMVLNKMLEKWGRDKKGILGAVLLSSLLFGLLHLVNLIGKPWLVVATGTQVVYALFLGIFFSAIYLRTKNLWSVIILHMLLDLGGCLDELFITKVTAKTVPDISLGDSMSVLAEWLIFLVLGLWYLRKVKEKIKK